MLFFYFIIILLILVLTITALIVLSTVLIQEFIYRGKPNAPFVPVPSESLPLIARLIKVYDNSVVYDLGSGDGKILRTLYDTYKVGKFVGIDRGFLPYTLSRIRHRKIGSISFQRKDFFVVDLSPATAVVTYLFPKLMDALLPKLKKELKSGTRLYSIDFHFKEKIPLEKIVLSNIKGVRGRTVYVYEF